MGKPSLYACRRRPTAAALVLTLATIVAPDLAAETPPCAQCLVLAATAQQAALVTGPLHGLEILVRVPGTANGGAGASADQPPEAAGESAVVAALTRIAEAGGRPGLLLSGPAFAASAAAVERAERILLDAAALTASDATLAFRLKSRLTELRGLRPAGGLGIVGEPALVAALGPELAPYLDVLATRGRFDPPYPAAALGLTATAAIVPVQDSGTSSRRWLSEWPEQPADAARIVADLGRAAAVLGEALIPGGTAAVTCSGASGSTFLDAASLDTIAVLRGCQARAVTVAPAVAGVTTINLSNGDTVVRVPAGDGRFAEGVQVVGARRLSVREIVARHQAAAARQRRAIAALISSGSMTLTFEAPGFPAPLAITSEAVIFSGPGDQGSAAAGGGADRIEIQQRDIRVNGIAFRGGAAPRLPLIEPERAASPPLAIALNDLYRYSFDGEAEVGGIRCYVVSFAPTDSSRSLFAGRVWIAVDSFAMVKVTAAQTGLRGPIVVSEQTDEFRQQAGALWLLARSEVRQIYEGAGHRTPIHRVLSIARHDVNPDDFEARRRAAYASPAIMLRDTPAGFRYLRRSPSSVAPGATAGSEPVAEPTTAPEVAGRATRVRTVAVGVIIDPNISHPLPFAGLSYVDFDLFGTGTQVNGFFGGSYGQLALSMPSLGGTRWQLAGRAFGIASSYNDRAFVEGREIYASNISQRPAHASAWLLRPLGSRMSARIGYELDYTHFSRAESTSADFRVPADQAAHALRLGLDGQWQGWTGSVWWAGARRAGWRQWGASEPATGIEPYDPAARDYQRAGATLARSFVASPRLVGKVEGAWTTGRDLDRFSRYTFGSFDNRLRGYPASLIRYERGGVVRAAAAWAASRYLRLDGFLDSALVHDPGFGPRLRNYTGVGAAAEVPAPFGTLVAVEWGYGFRGINATGRVGTQVLRVSGYKVF